MTAFKFEYIWLDGYNPEPNLRSKTKVINEIIEDYNNLPEWNYDGSSTRQADGNDYWRRRFPEQYSGTPDHG